MPSVSKSQQKLFQLVLAVREKKISRDEVDDNVLKIADSDMPISKIKAFAKTLKEHLLESIE